VPIQLPPVAGIITSKPSTPLSHINLLAKGWGIPNAYIKNARELFQQYDGWWVSFETKHDNYSIKRADLDEIHEYQRRMDQRLDVMKPRYNLDERRLLGLAQQRPELRLRVLQRVAREFPGKGLFVRSSSNSEDLPNFSGAGLYTTVPNVRGEEQTINAIKTVWASLWNFEAYEARERRSVDHTKIFMAVLLQEGINSESSGVMISTDPFDAENKGAIYISAKRGLGIKVVEGQKIAEQVIYRPSTNAIQVLTRSAEDSLLTFDEKGGVKEVSLTGDRVVLTDDVIRRLVRAATAIKRVFGSRDQDIEWAYMKGQIYIVQSRPFIPGG